eukprot:762028-Hanusia_phi.AAC.2
MDENSPEYERPQTKSSLTGKSRSHTNLCLAAGHICSRALQRSLILHRSHDQKARQNSTANLFCAPVCRPARHKSDK